MSDQNYSIQNVKGNSAKALGRNLHISPKQAIEICNHVRGRQLKQAKTILQQSIDMFRAIPFKRFTNGLGHKPGMSAGRYNIKACTAILGVIESAEANAKNKGFNAEDLVVKHICAQRAPKSWHYGRKKRSIFKSTHIEVALEEIKGSGKKDEKKSKTVKSSKQINASKKDNKKTNKKLN